MPNPTPDVVERARVIATAMPDEYPEGYALWLAEREAAEATELEQSLSRALAQSAAGETEDLGDFTQYAETDR